MKTNLKNFPPAIQWETDNRFIKWKEDFEAELREMLYDEWTCDDDIAIIREILGDD